MKNAILSLSAAFMLLLATACESPVDQLLRTADGRIVSLGDLVESLDGTSVVFIGEHHNNPNHHDAQLRLIKALHERKGAIAIGLEMFHAGHQEEIDAWLRGEMDTHDFIEVYYHNWSEDWNLYGDILLYARDNTLPLVALNASPDITRHVANHGFDSLTEEQLAELPGASCSIDADYEEFIRRALGEHEGDARSFRRFCEAQMVWDTTMAYRTVRYLEENPGETMVVLAGSGHSWKRGIPEQVRRQSRLSFTSVLPEAENGLSRTSVTADDTDYLWLGI